MPTTARKLPNPAKNNRLRFPFSWCKSVSYHRVDCHCLSPKTHNFMSNILSFKSCDLFLCEIDIERSNPIFQVFHFCCSNNRSYDSRFCSHPGSGDLPHGCAASIRDRLHGIYNAFIGFLGCRIERFHNMIGLTSFSIFLRTPWTSQDPASVPFLGHTAGFTGSVKRLRVEERFVQSWLTTRRSKN